MKVKSLSRVRFLVTPWTAAYQAPPSMGFSKQEYWSGVPLPVHHQLLEHAQTHVHQVDDASNHLILCRPLFLLPSILPSIRVFSNEFLLHNRWPKYWSFSFSISHTNEYSGLISFRMDWLDLLAVQGTDRPFSFILTQSLGKKNG